MGLGPALREEMRFEGGKMLNASLGRYRVPRFADVPELDIHLLDRPDLPSVGAGETPLIAVAPADRQRRPRRHRPPGPRDADPPGGLENGGDERDRVGNGSKGCGRGGTPGHGSHQIPRLVRTPCSLAGLAVRLDMGNRSRAARISRGAADGPERVRRPDVLGPRPGRGHPPTSPGESFGRGRSS